MRGSFLRAGVLGLICVMLCAQRVAAEQFVLPGFFEFRVDGKWKKAEVVQKKIGPVEYTQGMADWEEKKAKLVFASAQVLEPKKIKDLTKRVWDAKLMAQFMVDSLRAAPGSELQKSKPVVTKLDDAGPAELMFRVELDGAAMSGITLSGKKGAYAIVMFEEKAGKDRAAFWKAVGKTLTTK